MLEKDDKNTTFPTKGKDFDVPKVIQKEDAPLNFDSSDEEE